MHNLQPRTSNTCAGLFSGPRPDRSPGHATRVAAAVCGTALACVFWGSCSTGASGTPGADAGLNEPCDPLTNSGCPVGDKCSLRITSETPYVATMECVRAGTVPEGGVCSFGPTGAAGFDNCVTGTLCLDRVCTAICDPGPDTCRSAERACVVYDGFLADEGFGLCTSLCDPTAAAGCGADRGCYLSLGTGQATCQGLGNLEQGQVCAYLNACRPGLGCVLQTPDGRDNVCTAFCDPTTGATSVGSTCADALGAQSERARCVRINEFYVDTEYVAENLGMCIDCAGYASHPLCTRD